MSIAVWQESVTGFPWFGERTRNSKPFGSSQTARKTLCSLSELGKAVFLNLYKNSMARLQTILLVDKPAYYHNMGSCGKRM